MTRNCPRSTQAPHRAVGHRAQSRRAAQALGVRDLARLRAASLAALPSLVKPAVADPMAAARAQAEERARTQKATGLLVGMEKAQVEVRRDLRAPDRHPIGKAPLDPSRRRAPTSTQRMAKVPSGMALGSRRVGAANVLRPATARTSLGTSVQVQSQRTRATHDPRVPQAEVLARPMVRRTDRLLQGEVVIRRRRSKSRLGLRGGGLSIDTVWYTNHRPCCCSLYEGRTCKFSLAV